MTIVDTTNDPWIDVVGQAEAVRCLRAAAENPVHAYLFVGPPGTGKRLAAGIFAGELLAATDPEGAERHRRLATRFAHPDLRVVTPAGSVFRKEESLELVTEASRSPVEGRRKVIVAERFHDANDRAMPVLLKIAEEPPESTIFVFLADHISAEQVTVASRCTTIEFRSITDSVMVDVLVAEGVEAEVAARAAEGSGGSLTRGRLLATDERLMARRDAWRSVPSRLDGTGAAAAAIVDELRLLIDESMAPLRRLHESEIDELEKREELYGARGSGRKDLEAQHKRVERKHRRDELTFGFATLSRCYRDSLEKAEFSTVSQAVAVLERIDRASMALDRNANEALLLQALMIDLRAL